MSKTAFLFPGQGAQAVGMGQTVHDELPGLVKSVSAHAQIVLATQSAALLDEFEPKDIVVVQRRDGATSMERLDLAKIESWLEDCALSEIWDKNIFGGRP